MQLFDVSLFDKEMMAQIRAQYGESFPFWERLKRGRVGTGKIAYVSGFDPLDAVNDQFKRDLRCNFELKKKGIILHVNAANRKFYQAGVLFTELTGIQWPDASKSWNNRRELVTVQLNINQPKPVCFAVELDQLKALDQFFKQPELKHVQRLTS